MQFAQFIYDGVEPVEMAIYGVLSMARRIAPEIEMCTVAPRAGIVELANGLRVLADGKAVPGEPAAWAECVGGVDDLLLRRGGADGEGGGAGRRRRPAETRC